MEKYCHNSEKKELVWDDNEINKIIVKLGNIIREERARQNLTLAELARISNISIGTLQKIELGETNITFSNLIKIVYTLHLYPDEIIPINYISQNDQAEYFSRLTKDMSDEQLGSVFDMIKAIADIIEKTEEN